MRHGGLVVIFTAQLYSKEGLNSGSAQIHIVLAVCRRFAMVRISDISPGGQKFNVFRRSTIPQKQFITNTKMCLYFQLSKF